MAKPCLKCLLSEMDENIFFETIQQYVNAIPSEQKTPKEEYLRRLNICKACKHLVNGMCVLCGCYVEVRAAKLVQHCVQSKDSW